MTSTVPRSSHLIAMMTAFDAPAAPPADDFVITTQVSDVSVAYYTSVMLNEAEIPRPKTRPRPKP